MVGLILNFTKGLLFTSFIYYEILLGICLYYLCKHLKLLKHLQVLNAEKKTNKTFTGYLNINSSLQKVRVFSISYLFFLEGKFIN